MKHNSLGIGASLVSISLLALAVPAQAQDASPEVATKIASATEGGKAAGKNEKLICKRLEMSGTRMKSLRACHSKADWKKLDNGEF